jgi:hypothetical protein
MRFLYRDGHMASNGGEERPETGGDFAMRSRRPTLRCLK